MNKNIAASVRAKLTNHARATKRPFQEVLQLYGLERFLYRFSQTPASDFFLLKGALLLRVWGAPGSRPTRDIDFLGRTANVPAELETIIRTACDLNVIDDGLVYDSKSVSSAPIKKEADYHGVRVKFVGHLERARIPMQIDVGFGDSVYPHASMHDFPTILDMPAPKILMYSKANVIAEKFEAMTSLGAINSRYKDFYDIWHLCQNFDFSGIELTESIKRTFARRNTAFDENPVALQPNFATPGGHSLRTEAQWRAFLKRANLEGVPREFSHVQAVLSTFLLPIAQALSSDQPFASHWTAPGPWIELADHEAR